MDALSQETIAIIAVGAVIAGFFWSLHRDMASLRDRISRLEGLFEGLRDSVARLHESVSELRSSVTGLQGSVAAVQSSVSRLGQRVDNRFPPPPAADD